MRSGYLRSKRLLTRPGRALAAQFTKPPFGYGKQPEAAYTRSAYLYLAFVRRPALLVCVIAGLGTITLTALAFALNSSRLVVGAVWAFFLWLGVAVLLPAIFTWARPSSLEAPIPMGKKR